jgi:hypothetical protein
MSKATIKMGEKTHKFITETLPGIQAIFNLGFIPEEDEVLEFTEPYYQLYQKTEASLERPLYMVAAKNPKYSKNTKEVEVLTAKNVEQLNDARALLKKYALDNGVTSQDSDKILAFAAKNMPRYISEGTPFEQPKLRVLQPNEKVKTEREQWIEFLAGALPEGEGEIISLQFEDENGVKHEQIVDFASEAKWADKIDFGDLSQFEKVKDSLIVRPLNYQANISVLRDHMYRRVGDVALVIYAVLDNSESRLTTTKIDRKTIAAWNLPEPDLFDLALANTAKMFRPYLVPMEALIAGTTPKGYPAENKFFMDSGFKLAESRAGVYNLFVENSANAATAAFYKGALKKLSDILDDDLYIVLASMSYAVVHLKSRFALRGLRQTAKDEKHNPYADPAEFLSDRVYLYSRKDDNFDVAQ